MEIRIGGIFIIYTNIFLIVKQFMECIEITNKPMPSKIVGLFMVNTDKISNSLIIQINDIKYKCIYVKISNNSSLLSTLCHNE